MPGPFLDTNVIVYALAQNESRSERAQLLLAAGGTISIQVLNEFASLATSRKFGLSRERIGEAEAAIRTLCRVEPLTVETHDRALHLAEEHRLNFYDALIVAAAVEARCDKLYSEDMHDGLIVEGGLAIVNPFA